VIGRYQLYANIPHLLTIDTEAGSQLVHVEN